MTTIAKIWFILKTNIFKIPIMTNITFYWCICFINIIPSEIWILSYSSISSIVKWGYQDHFKPVYFFLRKDFAQIKSTKTQNKRLSPSYKFLHAKDCCLCCLVLLNFVLLFNVFLWVFLCAWKLFLKKINKPEIVSTTSFYYTTNVTVLSCY